MKTQRYIYLILIAGLVLLACSTQIKSSNYSMNGLKILSLGDSYTIGERVKVGERFPLQLAKKIQDSELSVIEPKIIARTGWTTGELLDAMNHADFSESGYDIVTLLIGVNNEYRGGTVKSYAPEFEELVERAIKLANNKPSHVFVLSIPDYGFTPYGKSGQKAISSRIDEFNKANQSISTRLKVNYIDITPVSRQGLEIKDLVADDGLHPSGLQYGEWVEKLFPSILSLLKSEK